MQLRILAALTFGGLLFFGIRLANPLQAADQPTTRVPVIVELFTSEGCSSCPPADALLRKLEEQQPVPGAQIIVLGEHVDYWNYIGWTDRFSSKDFTQRQEQYARIFNLDSAYTPQMVVNGERELNGADESSAKKAIAKAAKVQSNTSVRIRVTRMQDGGFGAIWNSSNGQAYLVITETNLQTVVKSGENKDRTLIHTGVVRFLRPLGDGKTWGGTIRHLDLDPSWKHDDLRVILFAEDPTNHHILAAAVSKLPD